MSNGGNRAHKMIVPSFAIEYRALSCASAIRALARCDPRFKHNSSITQNKSIWAARHGANANKISTPQTLRPVPSTMNGKIESRDRPGPFHRSVAAQTGWHLPRLARPPPQKFSPLLRRPKHFADGHLDDAPNHQLAGLSPHRFG